MQQLTLTTLIIFILAQKIITMQNVYLLCLSSFFCFQNRGSILLPPGSTPKLSYFAWSFANLSFVEADVSRMVYSAQKRTNEV